MVRAKNIFDDNFVRISKIDAIYVHLINNLGLQHQELEDLLRSEIVYAVSGLDRLIHELVKIGMVKIFQGLRPPGPGYANFQLTLGQHTDISTPGIIPGEAVFQEIIERKHGYLSFQEPAKIKEALNYIWTEDFKWQKIAAVMETTEVLVKQTLSNIVIRRNQIAHEMDLDLSTGVIQPLSHSDTQVMVSFIKLLGNTIYDLVK